MNMTIDCIIGIDPGKSGGIAIWRPNHKTEVKKMPSDLLTLKEWFDYMSEITKPIIFLEKIQMRTDDLNEPGKVFRIQKMLAEYEKLKAIISLSGIPFVMVHPQKWQNALKLRVKGEEKKERKIRYRNAAANNYPEVNATLWNADALMIMHFGRHILKSDTKWVLENLPTGMHERLFR